MPVIREVLRVFGQSLHHSASARRPLLWILVTVGAVLAAVVTVAAAAAPILIYPII